VTGRDSMALARRIGSGLVVPGSVGLMRRNGPKGWSAGWLRIEDHLDKCWAMGRKDSETGGGIREKDHRDHEATNQDGWSPVSTSPSLSFHSIYSYRTSHQSSRSDTRTKSHYPLPMTHYLLTVTNAQPYGGISLDISLMDKILRISPSDGDITVQPGVKWEDLNAHLKKEGVPLFFPLDPGPGATIGGMCGTGCSGTNAVRYGTAKAEWFLNLVSHK
jgi:hypothetical protein